MMNFRLNDETKFQKIISDSENEVLKFHTNELKKIVQNASDKIYAEVFYRDNQIRKEYNELLLFEHKGKPTEDKFLRELLGFFKDAQKLNKEQYCTFFAENKLPELKERWLKPKYQNIYSKFDHKVANETVFEYLGKIIAYEKLIYENYSDTTQEKIDNFRILDDFYGDLDTIFDILKKDNYISCNRKAFKRLFDKANRIEKVNWTGELKDLMSLFVFLEEKQFLASTKDKYVKICNLFLLNGQELIYHLDNTNLSSVFSIQKKKKKENTLYKKLEKNIKI